MVLLRLDGVKTVGSPIRCSRLISADIDKLPSAFYLSKFTSQPAVVGSFVGDTQKGGSCNVPIYTFTPHNLTHVETPSHIKHGAKNLKDYPPGFFTDIAHVVNLTTEDFPNNYILPQHLPEQLHPICSSFIFKTSASEENPAKNYSGTDPLSFHPDTMREIVSRWPRVKMILIDLPSVDKEDDGGKLLAHRNFFGLDDSPEGEQRAIIEFGQFRDLYAQYAYVVLTPAHIESDSMITDVLAYPLTI